MTRLPIIGIIACCVASATSSLAQDASSGLGPWQVRLRAMSVLPDEDASIRPITGSADIEDVVVPELDINYFFNDHIAAELVLMTSKHDVNATLAGVGKVDLGSVRLLPPTLLLQYHFLPHQRFRPYAGAGVNYTIFWDEDAPGGAVTDVDYDNSFAFAMQAGFDYGINKHWMLNFDFKRLMLDTDVTVKSALGTVNADVDINPWIVSAGIGYRF